MPFGSLKLLPGVNAERTPSLLEAQIATSSLIRFKDGIVEKMGGWVKFYASALTGVPRAILGWVDTIGTNHVAVGTTLELSVITAGVKTAITPQTLTTNNTPNFTTNSTTTVTIVDPSYIAVAGDVSFLATPVAIGGIVLFGGYQVVTATGTNTYTITAPTAATSSVSNAGTLPTYTSIIGSPTVGVGLANHGLFVGSTHQMLVPVSVGGLALSGNYSVSAIVSSSSFTITAATAATSGATVTINSGNAQIVYYYALLPTSLAQNYGAGAYGAGPYGIGIGTSSGRSGTPITATDWTLVNWGQILLACNPGGPIYQWNPVSNYGAAFPIATGPFSVQGICIALPQQILIAWGADFIPQASPLLLRWCNVGDYTSWNASAVNQAGSYPIPSGSQIVSVTPSPVAILVHTDIDVWVMQYVGYPNVFGFGKIGSNCGLVARGAAVILNTNTYWMGNDNFYVYAGGAVQTIPCAVWDVIFQNLNSNYIGKIKAGTISEHNEVIWHFPSLASTGENDSYVKYNVLEQVWDYDIVTEMPRSAWADPAFDIATVLGASPLGYIYSQESGENNDTAAMLPTFTTGYFVIAEGEEFLFIDWIIPDFRYGTYGTTGATLQVSVSVLTYPSDTPTVYGPYTVTAATPSIATRLRGRLASFTVASSDMNSFWRLGNVRFRFAPCGRR